MRTIKVIGTQYVTFITTVELEDDEELDLDSLDSSSFNYEFGDHTCTNIVDVNGGEILQEHIGYEF